MTTPPQPPPPPAGPPPAGGAPPPGYANSDEKTWALVAHFGGAAGMFVLGGVGGWIAPLIALMSRGNQSATVRQHAVNALNFQLTWSIVGVIGYLTICIVIGAVIIPVAALVGIIFGIIGGVKANDGVVYEYPVSVKMIK
ncbi:MAG: DUF4870 domain-containing protein [Micromonosporaceae bacterium]|nr:DUF4870 domain-containing protein [Micromonosporaceae bacterium]